MSADPPPADRDLSVLLPEAPLPRPARREAAIDEALRRFDGGTGSRPAEAKPPGRAPLWHRPQIGVLLAASLVAVIALPVWMLGDRPRPVPDAPLAIGTDTVPAPVASPASIAAAPADTAAPASEPPAKSEAAPPSAEAHVAAGGSSRADFAPPAAMQVAEPSETAPAPILAPPPPPPPAPAAPTAKAGAARSGEIIVTARRAEQRLQDVPVSVTAVTGDAVAAREAPRRLRAERSSRRGDWNACTVNDPARGAAACGNIAGGLSRAWAGDLDGAIADFDAVIATSPQSSAAYLNRGLAYERKGERDKALADLDRAVRRAPNSAQAHYQRSLVLRRKGDKARAEADAARAVELDPAYAAVIR